MQRLRANCSAGMRRTVRHMAVQTPPRGCGQRPGHNVQVGRCILLLPYLPKVGAAACTSIGRYRPAASAPDEDLFRHAPHLVKARWNHPSATRRQGTHGPILGTKPTNPPVCVAVEREPAPPPRPRAAQTGTGRGPKSPRAPLKSHHRAARKTGVLLDPMTSTPPKSAAGK